MATYPSDLWTLMCDRITPVALAASLQTSAFPDIHPCLSFVGWHRSCVPSSNSFWQRVSRM